MRDQKLVNERIEFAGKLSEDIKNLDWDTVNLQVAICMVTVASLMSLNSRVLWNMFRYSKKVSEVVRGGVTK